ncbi:MAG: phosphoribosylglycinamide formyltransferase [Acidobacteria bacterium]|nr:MAG: phosphoribosylglycinamide formyltransferase [Acidobacteriota bacterium]
MGVLLSGRGSNLAALLAACRDGRVPSPIAMVVSNVPDAPGLDHARKAEAPFQVVDHRQSSTREQHDRKVAEILEGAGITLICLAGYLRLLSPWFVQRFPDRILNIHPSLLPAFPGLHAQRQALRHGVKITGCTVHLVDEQLDAGPIILQSAVPVHDHDDEDTLSARILEQEQILYPKALSLVCEGKIHLRSRQEQ